MKRKCTKAYGSVLSKGRGTVIPAVCMAIAMLALTACGGEQTDPTGSSKDVEKEKPADSDAVSSGAYAADRESEEFPGEKGGAELPQPYARYMEILEQIRTEGHDPNGREYHWDESWDFEHNLFAILDVDYDGRAELIFNFNESNMAGMCEVVYEYDTETDTLREELAAWVMTEYYYNGLVKVPMSHNHGKDPECRGVWPYMVYQYDKEEDCYQLIYTVDSWDGQMNEEGFPDELDADGDKLLYCVTVENETAAGDASGITSESMSGGAGSMIEDTSVGGAMVFDREEYDSWEEELWMCEGNRMNVTYHPMTEESMESIKDAYIQASAYAAQAEVWFMGKESGPESGSYLLYDLDGDGSLELTASIMQGTGRYSCNYFYGLTDNGKVTELEMVRLCAGKERDWDADFDIGGQTRVQAYRDGSGIIYYEGRDYVRDGNYGVYDESGFYYLKDGVVYQDSIRRRTEYFGNGAGYQEEEIHYYGMEENEEEYISDEEITKEQYETIREKYIRDMTEVKVCQGWEYFLQKEIAEGDITEETICTRLLDSFLGSE